MWCLTVPPVSGNDESATNGSTPTTVDVSPTKRFFVRMLIRDIELVPAIVDLLDNSVDGAKLTHRGARQRSSH